MSGYRPADAFRSPRFTGIRTFMRLPHVTETAGVDFAVVGLPFDTATSYRSGARLGPAPALQPRAADRPVRAPLGRRPRRPRDLPRRHRGHLRPDRGRARAAR